MNDQSRRAIAYIVARLSTGKIASYVFDYQMGSYFSMSGQVSTSRVSIFDYTASNYVSGSGHNGSYNLFNYSTSGNITLRLDGRNFRGFDYQSETNFTGSVSPTGSVTFFDYKSSRYFNFKV